MKRTARLTNLLATSPLWCLSLLSAPTFSQTDVPNWQALSRAEITRMLSAQMDRASRIPNLDIRYSGNGAPYWLTGDAGVVIRDGTQPELDRFLEDLGPLYLSQGTEQLHLSSVRHVKDLNLTTYRADQTIHGLPVFGGQVVITTRADSGEVLKVSG